MGSGSDAVVQVAPGEFTNDAADAVKLAQGNNGKITCDDLIGQLKWQRMRAQHTLDQLLQVIFCEITSYKDLD